MVKKKKRSLIYFEGKVGMMLTYHTAGESHGKCLTAIVSGFPAGVALDPEFINRELARRQSGYGRGERMKIETDTADFTSGVRFGKTLGSPITILIENKDWKNWTDVMAAFGEETEEKKVTKPRPGHADLPGAMKFGHRDMRNVLERSSARHTATVVAVGALCKTLLENFQIKIFSHVINIGGVKAETKGLGFDDILELAEKSDLRCADKNAEARMIEKIKAAMKNGDSLGGVFEVIALRVPPGLGSVMNWDEKLDGRIAQAIMAINSVKGVGIGLGFAAASLPGSEVHDEILFAKDSSTLDKGFHTDGRFYRETNHAGGIEGGISNGEPIVVRAACKPIPTLMKPLKSVDIETKESFEAAKERSDCCVVPAAGVIGEASLAFILTQVFLEKFGSDSLREIKDNYASYMKYIDEY